MPTSAPVDAAPSAAPATGAPVSALAGAAALKVEEKAPESKAPAKLELKAPAGFEAHVEAFSKTAAELGLDGEKAQKAFDQVVAIDAARTKASEDAFAAQDAKWAAELQADAEIGGAKFKGAMGDVNRALKRFGGPMGEGQRVAPLAALLHQAGLGNHPLVLKAFAAIGRSLADDTVSGTAKAAPAAAQRLSDAELFYGPPTASNKDQ